jgi:D-alanyl-lipoteichoic acid acyltransferase DltB (MBOAT superfamily)
MDGCLSLVAVTAYILAGRWLVLSRIRGRHAAFALLNLVAAFCFYFEVDDARFAIMVALLFAGYVLLVVLQYIALYCWGGRAGWAPWLAFFVPILILCVIRYAPLEIIAVRLHPAIGGVLQRHPEIIISSYFIGISYIAFRTSYLVLEVRNGIVERPGFWEYLGFAFFVPTLPVGPISPFSLYRRAFGNTDRPIIPLGRALLRVIVGAVKFKFLGPLVNQIAYSGLLLDGNPHLWVDLPIAAVAYYIYLYCNFSGFCDMAIGGAGLMGIAVAENFDSPFAARNVKDFWNRWHITLSQYMRDVVFSPLSKMLVRSLGPANANHAIALTITTVFLIVGVWHGAGWRYAAFGAIHALGVVGNHYYTIWLKHRLGKEGFAAYNRSGSLRLIAQVLTFVYVTASLFLFANDEIAMKTIFSALRWH